MMPRAVYSTQGELQTAQSKASPQLTVHSAAPIAPSLILWSSMSFLPSHTFPRDRAKKGRQFSSHLNEQLLRSCQFPQGTQNSWDPLLTMPPLGDPRTSWRWCQMRHMVRVGAGCPQSVCACNSESSQVWARKTWQRTAGQHHPRDWVPT